MRADQYARMREAEDRHWWYLGMRDIAADAIKSAGLPPFAHILDAGCGTAGNLPMLGRFGSVLGVDVNSDALKLAADRASGTADPRVPRSALVRASVEDLPFRDHSFDLVTSFEVLYHRAVGDDVAALREFRRVLKPGGMVLLRLPAFEWLRGAHDQAVHTERRYTAAGLIAKLRRSGLRPIGVTYLNSILLPIVILKRAIERLVGAEGDDLAAMPPIVNAAGRRVLVAESRIARRWSLPIGASVQAWARRID